MMSHGLCTGEDPESYKRGGGEGWGPNSGKRGAGKLHLSIHFNVFLINLCKILQKRGRGGRGAQPLQTIP